MRSDVSQFELAAPPTLNAVLTQLSQAPGRHTLIAGGTELMVALNTGRLTSTSLLSIQHLRELRFIHTGPDVVHIGAGTTFSDIRRHTELLEALPLLAQAASWTGSIANQNRGTLGGNICNASPAADTPPALLAYGATLTLVSMTGMRTVPYEEFHLGYKKLALRADELLHTITVRRPAPDAHQYIRKVGTRNAQAISKVALAVVAEAQNGTLTNVRIGAASLADRPLRCKATEAAVVGSSLLPGQIDKVVRAARAALASEAKPIDDIRSTAKYRTAVACNLLEQFLREVAV